MQDDAIRTARIHSAVHPCTRDEVFIWQNFQPAYREAREPSQPALAYEHISRKFYKRIRGKARSRKPGQPGQPGLYERP